MSQMESEEAEYIRLSAVRGILLTVWRDLFVSLAKQASSEVFGKVIPLREIDVFFRGARQDGESWMDHDRSSTHAKNSVDKMWSAGLISEFSISREFGYTTVTASITEQGKAFLWRLHEAQALARPLMKASLDAGREAARAHARAHPDLETK
jgi:hypothetical protein